MKNNKLSTFLFRSIILIVLSVFILYKTVAYISDSYADKIFAELAGNYSANYIFEGNNFEKTPYIEKIYNLGGVILMIDSGGNVIYTSKKINSDHLHFEDVIALQNGLYTINGVEYYASIKKLPDKNIYGLVMLPSDIVNNVVTISLGNEDVKYVIYFILIRGVLLIPSIVILVFIFSRLVKRKLVQPLQNLTEAFNKLRNMEYSTLLKTESIDEFNDLNNSFKELSTTLKILSEKEKEYKRKRSQLFSDISHDLKTPITVIKGYSEAIIENRVEKCEIDKYITLIIKNADNLETLTLELSDIVNFERSDYELKLKKIELMEYFRQVIIDFLPLFEEKNINVVTQIPSGKFYYEIDVKLFSRVLQNLLLNVLDHNPEGIEILFKFEIVGDIIKIIIADSGVMISDDDIYDIFDEFKTYDESRNSSQNNNGLGLAIAKKIIGLHKGEIYLDTSYIGYSKAFVITLLL